MTKRAPPPTKVRSTQSGKSSSTPDDAEVGANPNCDKILSTLQRHWDLGQKIDVYCRSGAGCTIASFARQNRIPERTARIYFTFFWLFPEPELQKLKVLRRKTSDLPLNSGHVAYLLTIKSEVPGYGKTPERARQKFAEEAAVNSYSPTQLNSAIKRVCGRSSPNKGRPFTVREADVAVRQIAEDAAILTKRCRATWETLMVRTPQPIAERKQLRSLIEACKQYFEATEEIVTAWRRKEEITELTAKLEKAEAKIAKIK